MERHVVAPARDLPPGSRKRILVKGRPIVVFNLGGEFFGLSDRCPHQGASLSQGTLTGLAEATEPGRYSYTRRGEILRCPWHGWEFDIRTGQSWCDPSRIRARRFTVSVEPGCALEKGPYVAETVQVSVEDDYVVVHMP